MIPTTRMKSLIIIFIHVVISGSYVARITSCMKLIIEHSVFSQTKCKENGIIGTALAKEMGISRAAVYKILKEASCAIVT